MVGGWFWGGWEETQGTVSVAPGILGGLRWLYKSLGDQEGVWDLKDHSGLTPSLSPQEPQGCGRCNRPERHHPLRGS